MAEGLRTEIAHRTVVMLAQDATDKVQGYVFAGVQQQSDLQIVRNHSQIAFAAKKLGKFHTGAARINDNGIPVRNHLRGNCCDGLFLIRVFVPFAWFQLVGGAGHADGAAVGPAEQVFIFQIPQVVAGSDGGNPKQLAQLGHRYLF